MNQSFGLLGLLVSGPHHGYDLKRTIDQDFTPYWRIDYAQLYRTLAKLKRQGYIRAHLETGSGAPDRKVYTLTPQGRRAFETWLQASTAVTDELFVKLIFAERTGIRISAAVDAQRQALESERSARATSLQSVRAEGNLGRIISADAALRETEASLAALQLWSASSPQTQTDSANRPSADLVITGSDDPLLTFLAQMALTSSSAVGSLPGLLSLARHEADVAGVHLLDVDTGEYNVPFVRHLLPEDPALLINLAIRENGLLLARGNPKNIRGVRDLKRRGIRFINRQRGTGTRLLLYARLRAEKIDPRTLADWERVVTTHEAVAAAIATNQADAGPGLAAVAVEWGLDFIPLGEERYDLVTPQSVYESGRLEPLLAALHSADFKSKGAQLEGYDLGRTGRIVARIK